MKMQKDVSQAQANLSKSQHEGETGSGLVKVKINGNGELLDLKLAPVVLTEGAELLEDMIKAAFNVAYAKKEAAAKKALASSTMGAGALGLKIPGLG